MTRLLLVLALLLVPLPSLAQERPSRVFLDFAPGDMPEGCIDAAGISGGAEAILEQPVFVPRSEARHVLRGQIANDGEVWTGSIDVLDAEGRFIGSRTVAEHGDSCAVLSGPLILVVAMLVEAAPRFEREAAQRRSGVSLGVDAVAVLGLLPGVAPGIGISAGLGLGQTWTIRLEARAFLPRDETLVPEGTTANVGGRFFVAHAGPAICRTLLAASSLEFGGCLAGGLGLVRAKGTGGDERDILFRVYAHLEGRLELAYHPSPWFALRLGAGLQAPLLRRGFNASVVGETQEIHRISAVLPFSTLGMEFQH